MSILLPTRRFLLADGLDADARRYIRAVEAADGQALEPGVRRAYDQFVRGCKADGTWSAIKASCILAGARTLNGALVPLAGAAPTNFNFVSGDYDRKTGLVGNGSTKYLDSNRNNNADPQNSKHLSIYATTVANQNQAFASARDSVSSVGESSLTAAINSVSSGRANGQTSQNGASIVGMTANLLGVSRSSSSSFTYRAQQTNNASSGASETPAAFSIFIFGRNNGGTLTAPSSSRLAFYSIGEAVDLALLDARVTTLINAIAAAIP